MMHGSIRPVREALAWLVLLLGLLLPTGARAADADAPAPLEPTVVVAHAPAPPLAAAAGWRPGTPRLRARNGSPDVVFRTGRSLTIAGGVLWAVSVVAFAGVAGVAGNCEELGCMSLVVGLGLAMLPAAVGSVLIGVGVPVAASGVRMLDDSLPLTGCYVALGGLGGVVLGPILASAGAYTPGAILYIGGALAIPIGLLVQGIQTADHYREWDRGGLSLAPTVVSRSPGLALSVRF